jgi:hypothetical protein
MRRMDAAWVGVIGTGVGGLIGVGGSLGTRIVDLRQRRKDREADLVREDHARHIEERQRLYTEWIVAANEAVRALGHLTRAWGVDPSPDDDPAEPSAPDDLPFVQAWNQVNAKRAALRLLAPSSVNRATLDFSVALIAKEAASDPRKVAAGVYVPEGVDTDERRALGRAEHAMRADLHVPDP